MDYVLLAIATIFLISILVGMYHGALRIAVSLATTVLTLVVVFFATPYVSEVIETKTPLNEMIQEYVVKGVTQKVMSGEGTQTTLNEENVKRVLNAAGVSEETLEEHGITIDDIVNGTISDKELAQYGISSKLLDGLRNGANDVVAEEVANADVPKELQTEAIEEAGLPDIFEKLLQKNNKESVYQTLGVETFVQYAATYLAKLVIHILAFLGTFLFASILIRAIVFALNIVTELPMVGLVNRLAGGVLGAIGAMAIVWILFIVVTLLYTTGVGKEIYAVIQSNEITRLLYEYNPILLLATKM